jgi:hypothetical protein
MQVSLKISPIYIKSRFSTQILILLLVCGLFNIHASTLTADELRAHPGSIVLKAVQGNPLNETRSVFIFSALGTTLNWTQSKDVSWLTTNLSGGVTESILKIGVNTTGMPAGIYYGNVTIQSAQSSADPVIVPVTLIINPDVPVITTTWKDGYDAAMSVSVDDSQASGFDALQANGYKGTYVLQGISPPSFYTTYYYAGMELGSHTVNHHCSSVSDDALRTQELEPNISALCTLTPQPCKDVISLVWPCGDTNYREFYITIQMMMEQLFMPAQKVFG